MGISRAQLATYRGGTLPDLVGPGLRLLFVGYNPGLRSVAVQAPFPLRSNRFWPALYRAGILDRDIVATNGLADDDRAHVVARGVGITSLVAGATARASELTRAQLRAGAAGLARRLPDLRPAVVAILGITAYRVAFDRPKAVIGRQPEPLEGAAVWVVPNPSGLNAHETVASLAEAYGAAAVAAGIALTPRHP